MGEFGIKSLEIYDSDGNNITSLETPLTINTDKEDVGHYNVVNGNEITFDCKINRKDLWKLCKLISNYENLGLYYKLRVWIGFWISR